MSGITELKCIALLLFLLCCGILLAIDIGKARAGDDSLVKLEKKIKKWLSKNRRKDEA